ncbi:MAG TPA: SpoIIE family protein phosphatase [Terracidiphilus sp.]|nr:SpoIIE family protein phosphatase [Terracidiphilus sp.]
MLPRRAGLLALFTFLWAGSAGFFCHAEQSQPISPVRYHFGDQPNSGARWAEPDFDDSAWPVAHQGRWPFPDLTADGLMWVRVRVPVRSDAAGPLAIRVFNAGDRLADEIFVNGVLVGRQGKFPPHVLYTRDSVFDLPSGVTAPGATAVVAFRAWYAPLGYLGRGTFASAGFDIDGSRSLRLADHAAHLEDLIAAGPNLALNSVIAILGVALLVFWRWASGRELLLCSGVLLLFSIPSLYRDSGSLGILVIPWRLDAIVGATLQAASMAIMVELMWTIYGLRALGLKRLTQAAVLGINAPLMYVRLIVAPSAAMPLLHVATLVSVQCFILIIFGTNAWAFFARRQNRLVATALALIQIATFISILGISTEKMIGPFHFRLLELGFFASSIALFIMLAQRAWQGWRARDELRVEFEAAREVQERLVAAAVDVPGFKIESVYAPAKQVGGDFFRIFPESDGSVLVVVGDVSGKGLKAAMTVSAIMGAMRGCPSRSPAEVLDYLNRVLYGQVDGFVTCCATLIAADGATTHANAGNPAPYRNGEEMGVESGVPLGIVAENCYRQIRSQIAPGDRLTFISDGVLEATSPAGELYGFERTQAISNQPANSIAEAARQFGQEDDITVLSITRTAGLEPALA